MALKRFPWLVLLLVMWPAQADDSDQQLTEARTVFLRGVDGDKTAVRDALRQFRTLSHNHPKEPVFIAYLGACMTLRGRDAANNIEKGRLTEEGLAQIDLALKLLAESGDKGSPRALDTKLVAVNAFIHIPSFFNRHGEGKRLLQEILAHPSFDGMAAGFKAAAYMAAALVARGDHDDEAYRRYLNLAASTDPEGRDGKTASKMLEEK